MNISFENKRVLVTGAGRGIGRAAVKAFVRGKAAKIFAVSRTKSYLDELVREEPSVVAIAVDLSDLEATKKAIENVGPIDILVNNAAIFESINFIDMKPEDFKRIFDVNFQSVITVSQIIVKSMIERKQGGSIVNVSSRIAFRGAPGLSLYSASKAALDALTRNMAVELGQHNIRVNSVNPGVVRTDMAKDLLANKELMDIYYSKIPLARISEPEDVVNAILFFASEKSTMVDGHALPLDGGSLIMG